MSEIRLLEMRALEIAYEALDEIFQDDPEPVPPWSEGDREKLETIASCTETGAMGIAKYPDIPRKAAKLFYSAIKIHPFPNGNKRFAFVLTLSFLILNGRRLTAPQGVGAETAKWVADSDPHSAEGNPDRVIGLLAVFFAENTESYDWLSNWDAPTDDAE